MSAMPDKIDLEVIKAWLGPHGFHSVLRMTVLDHDSDAQRLRLSLPFREEYTRIPQVGDYHGGVLSALLDVAGTFVAALSAGGVVATTSLRTDYLRPPIRCDLIATARTVRAGRSVVVADVEIADADGRLYAIGRGTWSPVAPPARP